jgi:hypothetical protein
MRPLWLLVAALWCQVGLAQETLIDSARARDGSLVSYILDAQTATPKYLMILFPGGHGVVSPHLENGQLVYQERDNFLLRSRPLLVDDEFATVATDVSTDSLRIQALLNDLQVRFPRAKVYLIGTSRGTTATLALAPYLASRIAGEIHTSSMASVANFDARQIANRQLLVHNRDDQCQETPFAAAEAAHERYGDELIVMSGGVSRGPPCRPFAYHGFDGIESQTIAAIKAWVKLAD